MGFSIPIFRSRRTLVIVLLLIVAVTGGLWWVDGSVKLVTYEERLDVPNQWFYRHEQGVPQEKVRLTDGVYVGDGDTIRLVGDPIYDFDVDGDKVADVVAVLESTATPRWQAVYFWIVQGDALTPVEWPAAWQWVCVVSDQPRDPELDVVDNGDSRGIGIMRGSDYPCGDGFDRMGPRSFSVGVFDGIPVSTWDREAVFATEACRLPDGKDPNGEDKFVDVTDVVTPLVQPRRGAPPVTGPDESDGKLPERKFTVHEGINPDETYLKIHNGYIPILVKWYGWTGCGWVPWSDVKPLIDDHLARLVAVGGRQDP